MLKLKNSIKDTVLALLLLIPLSALIAGIAYFLMKVPLKQDFDYITAWGDIYVLLSVIWLIVETVNFVITILGFNAVSRTIGVSYKTVEIAIIKYKLQKVKPPSEWTKEWLEQRIAISEVAHTYAEAIVDQQYNRK